MRNELLISRVGRETRVAVLDDGVLSGYHVQRDAERGQVGNVYLGRVTRVLPGIQAAFVDIGLPRAAFLYGGDVRQTPRTAPEGMRLPEGEQVDARQPIQRALHEGQKVVVQVVKDPIGTKGARVSGYLSLPGRFLVFLPSVDHVGVSRRIADDAERERLRGIIEEERREDEGYIVRTACEGRDPATLREDMAYLRRLWGAIHRRIEEADPATLIHEDLELGLRAMRDIMTEDTARVVVDDPHLYQRVRDFAEQFLPRLAPRVELHEGIEPLLDQPAVETGLARLLGRQVWLKSGGYIVIDQTEALVAIDVNTGRFVGQESMEDTTLRVNLEAVREIVHQLQLRDIGGIIVIDFIDMAEAAHREEVYRALTDELVRDRARTSVLPISEFGLVEMTRKRVREDLVRYLSEPCLYCDGRGYTKSRATICYEVLNALRRVALKRPADWIVVRCHAEVAHLLVDAEQESLQDIEGRYGFRTHVEPVADIHLERFEVRPCAPGEVPG